MALSLTSRCPCSAYTVVLKKSLDTARLQTGRGLCHETACLEWKPIQYERHRSLLSFWWFYLIASSQGMLQPDGYIFGSWDFEAEVRDCMRSDSTKPLNTNTAKRGSAQEMYNIVVKAVHNRRTTTHITVHYTCTTVIVSTVQILPASVPCSSNILWKIALCKLCYYTTSLMNCSQVSYSADITL